jgi:hypothetical protein
LVRHPRWRHALLAVNLLAIPGYLILWQIISSADLALAAAATSLPLMLAVGLAGAAVTMDILTLAHHIAGPGVYNKH